MLAFMQFRLGPNRTGPFGLLQPVADGIKLFFKEEVIPEGANKWLFVAAPGLAMVTAFLAIAVVPWGGRHLPRWLPAMAGGRAVCSRSPTSTSACCTSSRSRRCRVYAIVMAGWAANNKFTLLGGLRSSAQMFSYELALGLSWVGVIMLAGSFRIGDIVAAQDGWVISDWNFCQAAPGLPRLPGRRARPRRTARRSTCPEAETELVAGFHTEYSSMRFALLQMAEYVNMITIAAVGANLFLGRLALARPVPARLAGSGSSSSCSAFLLLLHLAARTLPRFRYDQLMDFGWKVLVPAGHAEPAGHRRPWWCCSQ